jgi:hypothetical protein
MNMMVPKYLIHMLAKQETPMKDRMTMLGLVPAKLRSLVIRTRSMFVLLRAEAMVNPPMRSIIVGENIWENTYLPRLLNSIQGERWRTLTSWRLALIGASDHYRIRRLEGPLGGRV